MIDIFVQSKYTFVTNLKSYSLIETIGILLNPPTLQVISLLPYLLNYGMITYSTVERFVYKNLLNTSAGCWNSLLNHLSFPRK